jgi:hypothetical protein
MVFNILMKKEDEMFIAHCMELDIVATGSSVDETTQDMIDLIIAQLKYAFLNDNLDHLYRPAPPEVWREFYLCKESPEEIEIQLPLPSKTDSPQGFIPPWIIAKMCKLAECHV